VGRLYRLQPLRLPKKQAAGLASAMRRSVAPKVLKKDRISHATSHDSGRGIAGLVRNISDPKAAAAILEHFRHERKAVAKQATIRAEHREDFFLTSNFDQIARAKHGYTSF